MKRILLSFLLILGATVSAVAQNQASYGVGVETSSGAGGASYFVGEYITVTAPINVTTGYFYVGGGGTVGGLTDLLITAATAYNAQATSATCHATYNDPGGTASVWAIFTFTGCTLAAGNYFIGYDTSDDTLATGGYTGIGGSCVAESAAAAATGNMCDYYVAQTYGTYTGFSTSFNGTESQLRPIYIVGTPATPANPIGKRGSQF